MGRPSKKRTRRPHQKSAATNHRGELWIYGRHAVGEVLANQARHIVKLHATMNTARDFETQAKKRHVEITNRSANEISAQLPPGAVHQGIAASVHPLVEIALSDLALDRHIVVLDQVTDPHNVGAILRSAAVFNIAALVMTHRNSPPLSGVLAKSACGGLEHVQIIQVNNLSQCLREIGDLGFFRVGLAGEVEPSLETSLPKGPIALVLGAEDKGLRRLTRENCDMLCQIRTGGALSSLNVSNAAAVAFHTLLSKSSS